MVSVIICSINKTLALQVEKNIDKTIGVPWELILIDNTQSKKGITSVYNEGAARARYDILCFVHEDVAFETQNWGRLIQQYFDNDAQLGLVGVAGANYKARTWSGWWTGIPSFDYCNIFTGSNLETAIKTYLNPDPTIKFHQAVVADGVFLCVRKQAWEGSKFNETLIDGFHFYDIDFSFNIARSHKVAITLEIDILHFKMGGDYGDVWMRFAIPWHRQFKNELPFSTAGDIKRNVERTIYKHWLMRLKGEKISFANRLKWIFQGGHWLYVPVWPYIGLFLFYKLFRR
jgi:hypothetical protein